MSNVVNLVNPDRLVWVCICGCKTFKVYANDTMECAHCGSTSTAEAGGWRLNLPEPTPTDEDSGGAIRCVQFDGEEDAMVRRAKNEIIKRFLDDEALAAMIIMRDGVVSGWIGEKADTPKRLRWLKKYTLKAFRLITT